MLFTDKKAYFSIMVHFKIIAQTKPAVKRMTAGFLIFYKFFINSIVIPIFQQKKRSAACTLFNVQCTIYNVQWISCHPERSEGSYPQKRLYQKDSSLRSEWHGTFRMTRDVQNDLFARLWALCFELLNCYMCLTGLLSHLVIFAQAIAREPGPIWQPILRESGE